MFFTAKLQNFFKKIPPVIIINYRAKEKPSSIPEGVPYPLSFTDIATRGSQSV